MKKNAKPYKKKYPLQRLYRDDIDEIISIFQSSFSKFYIYVDDYQLDDPKELDNIKKKTLTYFCIKYYNVELGKSWAILELELKKSSATLTLSDDANTEISGVALRIDRLISSKKSFVGFVTSRWLLTSFVITALGSIFVILAQIVDKHSTLSMILSYINSMLPFFNAFWVLWACFLYFFRHTIIYMDHSSTKSNLLSRNSDQIIINLFYILLGFILGILAEVIKNNLVPPKK